MLLSCLFTGRPVNTVLEASGVWRRIAAYNKGVIAAGVTAWPPAQQAEPRQAAAPTLSPMGSNTPELRRAAEGRTVSIRAVGNTQEKVKTSEKVKQRAVGVHSR